ALDQDFVHAALALVCAYRFQGAVVNAKSAYESLINFLAARRERSAAGLAGPLEKGLAHRLLDFADYADGRWLGNIRASCTFGEASFRNGVDKNPHFSDTHVTHRRYPKVIYNKVFKSVQYKRCRATFCPARSLARFGATARRSHA